MTNETPVIPDRTLSQRKAALQRANTIRKLRADDKALIRDRVLDAREILRNPPEYWAGAKIAELLLAVRGVGHGKVEAMLKRLQISPGRTLSGLTESQRERLCESLQRFYAGRL